MKSVFSKRVLLTTDPFCNNSSHIEVLETELYILNANLLFFRSEGRWGGGLFLPLPSPTGLSCMSLTQKGTPGWILLSKGAVDLRRWSDKFCISIYFMSLKMPVRDPQRWYILATTNKSSVHGTGVTRWWPFEGTSWSWVGCFYSKVNAFCWGFTCGVLWQVNIINRFTGVLLTQSKFLCWSMSNLSLFIQHNTMDSRMVSLFKALYM